MKVFLLLLFITSLVFGETWNDEWPIYVYGDASYYKLIFDGIAMVVQDHNYMDSVFKMVFGASSLFAAKNFNQYNLKGALWNVGAGLGMTTMLLYPTSTVHILDVRTLHGYVQTDPSGQNAGDYSGYQKVDHIPFYLAVTASLATSLKYHIIDISTDALTPISGSSFRDSGFATPMLMAESMISLSSFKFSADDQYVVPKFGQALSHYTEKCIVENVLYIDQTRVHGIMDPKINQLDALDPANFADQNLRDVMIDGLKNGQITCGTFWDAEIAAKKNDVSQKMQELQAAKFPNINMSAMAESLMAVAGLEADAAVAMANMQNAALNIGGTAVVMNAFKRAGTGLSGIELSNEMMAQQSLLANMTDSTGQFKWMIRVIPVLEFLIFGIMLFLAIPMALVAGLSGAEKGGKMIMNYSFGLIAFSFIDVALAIVQAVSFYYYKDKMAEAVLMLGGNPFTANSIPLYLQELGYMSGMMGLAAVMVVPLVVGIIFKGETMAAAGAYSSVMGKYKGDAGGTNAQSSLSTGAAVHAAEGTSYEEYSRRNLADWGIPVPKGALASDVWNKVSAEAASYGSNMGVHRAAGNQSLSEFSGDRAKAGMGSGAQKVTAEIGSGLGALEAMNSSESALSDFGRQSFIDSRVGFATQANKGKAERTNKELSIENQIAAAQGSAESDLRKSVGAGLGAKAAFDAGMGADFSLQTQTDATAGIASQATKGGLSRTNKELSPEAQISAAQVLAADSLGKSISSAKGLVDSGAIGANGSSVGGDYLTGMAIQARAQSEKTMGAADWAQKKDAEAMTKAMEAIRATGGMGMAGDVSKGRGFLDGAYKGDLNKFESDGTDIEKSKSDSMFGQAKGVRSNYDKNKDMYSQNAEYGEESKQQATDAKIKTLGGIDKAVALDVTMATGKALADATTVQVANERYADKGGYVGLQKDSANIQTQKSIGDTRGLMDTPIEHRANYLNGMLDKAELGGRYDDVKKGLQAANLVNEKGEVTPENWVSGMAYLKANNMNSANAAVVGGMVFSGAVGADSTIQASAIDSLKSGSETQFTQQTKSLAQMYNVGRDEKNQLKLQSNGDIDYKNTSPQALAGFASFAQNSNLAKNTKDNFLNDFVAKVADETGAEESTVWGAMAGVGAMGVNSMFGNPAGKLWNKIDPLGKNESNSFNSEGKNNSANHQANKGDSDHTQHNNSSNSDTDSVSNNAEKGNTGGGIRKKIAMLGGGMALGAVASEAGTFTPTGASNSGVLGTASSVLGDAEMAVGLGTLGAEAMSKFSTVAMGAAKFGAKIAPGVGMAFGTADAAYRASEGDNLGAAMSAGIAAVSSVPVIGTAAAVAGGLAQIATDAMGITGAHNSAAPQHQGFMTQPSGYHTTQAQAAQAQISMAGNIETLSSLTQSRSGGFMMSDAHGEMVSFTTDKGAGHNLMMNKQDTGIPYQQFSSMMQNNDMASQFSNAISSSSMSNQEGQNSVSKILQEMSYKSSEAQMSQRMNTNAGMTNQAMHHKELVETLKEGSKSKEDSY